MIDNSDIPFPLDQVRCRVLVFAVTDESSQQYQQINKGYVYLTTDDDGNNHTIYSLQVKCQKTNEIIMRSILTIQNNFGKQKDSIISWTDESQLQYSELAISFEKDNECDQFWKMICEKIGKSYLQICGGQRLQIPNLNNLNYFLQKAKNYIDLVDYNIVHSKNILQGLRQVFNQMKLSNDQMGLGILSRIINSIISPSYSLNSIKSLLTGQNFYMILDLQQFKRNIKFKQIYEIKIGNLIKNKFNFPKQIFQKIQLSHRALFYRENVLQLSEQGQLESMMFIISKQSIVQIMSYLNRSKFFQKIYFQKMDQIQQINNDDKISLILEALIMYQHINSQQIKTTFKQNIYVGEILSFTKNQIQKNNVKTMEILYYIALVDCEKFLQYLAQDYKSNSTDNLLKTLMKKYINQSNMRKPILSLIQSLIPIFNQKRQTIQFFKGTFVYSVLSVSNNSKSIIQLSNLLISQLQYSNYIINQLVQLKIFFKLASQYRNGTFLKCKSQELQMLKLLKFLIIEKNRKKQLKDKQIQQNVIDSGYFDCCMLIYFKYSQKNNILNSSMLQNFKLIVQSDYSKFDQYLAKEYSINQSLELKRFIDPIKIKYINFINNNNQKQKQVDYLQIQKVNHESVLENQIQDSYLMNDQNTQQTQQLIVNLNKNNQIIKSDNNSQLQRLKYLEKLKRMLHEVGQKNQDQTQIDKKKKYVKKNEELKQNFIQFSFQLPDMNEIGSNQYT